MYGMGCFYIENGLWKNSQGQRFEKWSKMEKKIFGIRFRMRKDKVIY